MLFGLIILCFIVTRGDLAKIFPGQYKDPLWLAAPLHPLSLPWAGNLFLISLMHTHTSAGTLTYERKFTCMPCLSQDLVSSEGVVICGSGESSDRDSPPDQAAVSRS